MPPNICHTFLITNLTDSNHEGVTCCHNRHEVSDLEKTKERKSCNILEHEEVPRPPCVKRVRKALTTYRDHYCGKKSKPEAQKICLPFTAILLSGEKINTVSTYKDDFPAYNAKDLKDNRSTAIAQKHSLGCAKNRFEGKSETKAAFKPINIKNKSPVRSRATSYLKESNKFKENKPFIAITTYSSEYGKPKISEKAVCYTPKQNITVPKEPFKHVSQYMKEFQTHKTTKDPSDSRLKKSFYKPPLIPMDNMTTYNASFTFKKPTSKPQVRRYPDYRCKECKISNSQQKKTEKTDQDINCTLAGDGDKAVQQNKNSLRETNYHPEIGDCIKNSCALSDKVCVSLITPASSYEKCSDIKGSADTSVPNQYIEIKCYN